MAGEVDREREKRTRLRAEDREKEYVLGKTTHSSQLRRFIKLNKQIIVESMSMTFSKVSNRLIPSNKQNQRQITKPL